MITIRQHRAIGPFAVRVELTTNLSASWAAGRVRLDRNHTHVLRGLDPVECAARKDHTGRRAARWLWPHSRNTLSIRFWGPEFHVREEIGRGQVRTHGNNAHIVSRLLLEKKN